MAALRKPTHDPMPGQSAPAPSSVGLDVFESTAIAVGASPAHLLQEQVRSVFAADALPLDTRYPVAVRLAIIAGSSVALWSMIGAAIFSIL